LEMVSKANIRDEERDSVNGASPIAMVGPLNFRRQLIQVIPQICSKKL
jgi:hypothetical protein